MVPSGSRTMTARRLPAGRSRSPITTRMAASGGRDPTPYSNRVGGMGRAVAAIRERKGSPLRVAVIGLGAGTLTCAAEPGESWKFFEIDQSMVDTARDPRFFTYI